MRVYLVIRELTHYNRKRLFWKKGDILVKPNYVILSKKYCKELSFVDVWELKRQNKWKI